MAIAGEPLAVQLLGPVRAWRHGREVALGPPKQRAVFALLAGRANDVVSVDHIIDAVWGGDIPQTASNGVHTYVAGLRRALEPERSRRESGELLISTAGGYALQTDPEAVDATLFARRHTEARRARAEGRLQEALDHAESALSLWHGEAHSGVPGPFAVMERTRLQDLRLTAVEEWAGDMLEADRPVEAVTVLLGAVAEEPLREKLRWLLMTALYRCGRQAHALEVYAETRRLLRHELGIDPSAELRTLHQQILAGSPVTPTGAARTGTVTAVGTRAPAPEPPAARLVLSETPRPAQLPPVARGFVGRSQELEQLARLLTENDPRGASTPIVVIDGPAGVGKSAFALELAHRLSGHFPDGQLYVDLHGTSMEGRSLSASEALLQVLRSLGVDNARIPADLASRATLYRSLLHGKRVLVMLDDVLSADQLRPLIPGGSSCVLSTGRQRLGGLAVRDGAHLLRLEPLGTQDALSLLRCLSGDRLRHQEAVARRLVGLSGGRPLALRMMAETLAANQDVPLSALVEHIAEEHGRLDRLAVGGDASTSLHTLFETSYQALPDEAARMFRLLGLYSAGLITVSAAADLAGTTEPEAAGTLRLLARRHLLVEAGRGAYRFHELMRLYAAECAEREPLTHRSAAVARLLQATVSVA
ncbi:AfsR/SARP family transcriptional regulator [Streptomyces roseochromogenus]|uniref:AfsR family transcriptional regulator n=1 Tax=Streptomyces roseochromogenus subsp. oscitans DS 12.976 TaxID=1352936 RepID=V6KL43_STRRC|nr:BTAD domain-containing putative transcriptional regulator [Streptomyces roseochromogenus]EST32920.1 AfsR family transcriptional regulator [Streptomyces roseochromogenus subsp. oscitans DS 12.976]